METPKEKLEVSNDPATKSEEKHLESEANATEHYISKECDDIDDILIEKYLEKLTLNPKTECLQVLKAPTIDAVIEYIQSGKCRNIITMAGAGISTAAGIPDFRSPGSGLYNNLAKYNLPHPEAIFDLDYFNHNPKPFYALAKQLYPNLLKPTLSHHFIRLLHEKGLLLRHYTQNIDTLEHIVGIPCDKVIEAHGTFRRAHCIKCDKEYSQEWIKEKIFSDDIPHCDSCSGVVKPDIIFFGESLPEKFFTSIQSDFGKCDLLIILGTSLAVRPFSSLVSRVSHSCPRLLINLESVQLDFDLFLNAFSPKKEAKSCFEKPGNTRDVALIGDCDEGCSSLAERLGWKADLDALIATTDSKL